MLRTCHSVVGFQLSQERVWSCARWLSPAKVSICRGWTALPVLQIPFSPEGDLKNAEGPRDMYLKICILLGSLWASHGTKKQRHYFVNKGPSSQGYGFSSGHVWMWELDCEESWVLKNWCFWTVVLEKPLESALDCKEIQPVHPKGDQSWMFIRRIDAEADAKSWLIRKDPDAGKYWGQEEKGTTEDEMVGWHHWLDGHEFG